MMTAAFPFKWKGTDLPTERFSSLEVCGNTWKYISDPSGWFHLSLSLLDLISLFNRFITHKYSSPSSFSQHFNSSLLSPAGHWKNKIKITFLTDLSVWTVVLLVYDCIYLCLFFSSTSITLGSNYCVFSSSSQLLIIVVVKCQRWTKYSDILTAVKVPV